MPADDSHQGSEKRRAIEISDQDTESQSSGASENAASYDTPRKPRLKRQYYKRTSLNDTLAPEPRRREYWVNVKAGLLLVSPYFKADRVNERRRLTHNSRGSRQDGAAAAAACKEALTGVKLEVIQPRERARSATGMFSWCWRAGSVIENYNDESGLHWHVNIHRLYSRGCGDGW